MKTKRYMVRHFQAVWERATFNAEVPDPLPDDCDDAESWITDNLSELMGLAMDKSEFSTKIDENVEGIDTSMELTSL